MKKAGEKAVQTFFSSKRWREGVWIGRREKMDNVVYVSTIMIIQMMNFVETIEENRLMYDENY